VLALARLINGTGLQAFAVVVSRQPLPSFKDWWTKYRGCPWGRFQGTPGIVWWANSIDAVEPLSELISRAKPKVTEAPQVMKKLAEWLLQSPGIVSIEMLGFSVEPKEKR
jgi:hypothetical protein